MTLVVTLLMMTVSLAQAGIEVGNGGGAWVCTNPDPEQSIRSAELVDLYESHASWGMDVRRNEQPPEKQLTDAVARLQNMDFRFTWELAPYLALVRERWPTKDSGKRGIIDDVLYWQAPPQEDCPRGKLEYGQIANFTHDGRILVDQRLFKALPKTDQAALMLHEAVYAMTRAMHGEQDSRLARRIVGIAFLNHSPRETDRELLASFFNKGSPARDVLHAIPLVFACGNATRSYLVDAPSIGLGLRGSSAPSRSAINDSAETTVTANSERPSHGESAADCEAYLDDFSIRRTSVYGFETEELVATLITRPDLQILGAGGYFRYEEDRQETAVESIVAGTRRTGGRYSVAWNSSWNHYNQRIGRRHILEFAYYVDIFSRGTSHRYWLQNGSKPFSADDFHAAHPCYSQEVFLGGYSSARYLSRESSSPLFNGRQSCLHR